MSKKKSSFFKISLPVTIFGIDSQMITLFVPPLVLVVVFLISLGLIIMPSWENIGKFKQDLDKLESDKAKILEKENYLLSVDEEELLNNSKALDRALMDEGNAYLLVGVVRQVAEKHGYRISSFSVAIGEIKEDVTDGKIDAVKLPIEISLLGPGGDFLDLIDSLENGLPVLSIDSLEVKKGTLTNIDLQVSAYYIPEEKKVNAEKLSLTDLTLTKRESEVISTISSFAESGNVVETYFGSQQEGFKPYPVRDPFFLSN